MFEVVLKTRPSMVEAREGSWRSAGRTSGSQAHAALNAPFFPPLKSDVAAIDAEVKLNVANGDEYSRNITSAVSSAQFEIVVGLLIAVAVSGGLAAFIITSTGKACDCP